jgi:37-kD nucleoid-associated bacterial protein
VNLDSFSVETAVIHDVPRAREDGGGLTLTDAPIALDDQLRRYFRRKIVESLKLRGLDVVADPTASAAVRAAVASIAADPDRLVAASKEIAQHLDASQDRRNPGGLLAVVRGRLDTGPALAILKLEREEGLRLRIVHEQGHAVVDLEFLRDLTLTDKTRIFKTSILQLERDGDPETMFGRASDDQRGKFEGLGVATFFLATFLGSKLRTNPEKTTRDFVAAAEEFINEDVESAEKRARYQVALLAKMQDQSLDLRASDFASETLDPNDRSAFLERVAAHGVAPEQAFAKDLALVKVDGFRIVFEHGMVLVGRREDVEARRLTVTRRPETDGVVIRDTIKRLGGR